jgi:hypothetical protein
VIYPNPVREQLNLSFEVNLPQDIEIRLNSANGETVYFDQSNWLSGEYKNAIDVSSLSRGIYFLQIKSDLGTTMKKVVVQ